MSCCLSCCASLTCGLCTSVASGISQKSARIGYCGLFGASLILSWVLREVGAPLLEKIPWIDSSHTHTKEWYQVQCVLRVSLGNFLFFGILALIMIGVKDQNDKRDSWHHGGWTVKMIIWLLLVILSFLIPDFVMIGYGFISKFGAGLFLLIQVIILLDCTHNWNDAWVEKDERKWYIALLAVSIGCYIGAYALSGILFIWFNPSGYDCGLNVFFLVMTMILAFLFAVISLHPQVNGSLLPASVISIYCAYVCYTGLQSEPRDYECNGLNKSRAVNTGTLVLGMITTVLSVLYSALRAGSSTTFLSPPSSPRSGGNKPLLEEELEEGKTKKEEKEAKPVSYSYSFFHLIFALATMYSAMLLSGWTSTNEGTDLIDVGWTSVWVRIGTEWVTAGLYIWTLVAPSLFPDREFA
ncbi:putative serine incorporator/TMS membrane protein [Lupinus albus]|uniref:Putative serine incorporator/TMS membrane protein n=1 Tax=Lupinus albus TaxID=3870 RepID=A0A6A4NR39_LUPAL|nr:putative serine incorporator/TMS membrane protein [Lupinus albus]